MAQGLHSSMPRDLVRSDAGLDKRAVTYRELRDIFILNPDKVFRSSVVGISDPSREAVVDLPREDVRRHLPMDSPNKAMLVHYEAFWKDS